MRGTTFLIAAAVLGGAAYIAARRQAAADSDTNLPSFQQYQQSVYGQGGMSPIPVASLAEYQATYGKWDKGQLGLSLEQAGSNIMAGLGQWDYSSGTPDPMTAGGGSLGQQIDPVTGVPLTGQYYPGNLVINPAIGAARMARSMMR